MSSSVSLVPTSPSLYHYQYHYQCCCFLLFLMLMSSLYLWVPHGDDVYNIYRDGTHTRVKNVNVLKLVAWIFSLEISFKNPSALLALPHVLLVCLPHLASFCNSCCWSWDILHFDWSELKGTPFPFKSRLIPISLHSQDCAVAFHGLYVM